MNAKGPRSSSAWMPALMIALSLPVLHSETMMADDKTRHETRVPAEWEPQEAIWLQWPGKYEKAFETAFGKMAAVIIGYQKLHIIHDSDRIRKDAETAIRSAGGNPGHDNIVWHKIRNDSAWMRDNGPVYVVQDGEMRIQNWQFNAWGGAFGPEIPFIHDNAIPDEVGKFLNMPVDPVNIVHERGNLEFNGVDTVLLNWSTLGDPKRNPGYGREQAKRDLKKYFGVRKVVFVQGVPEGDLTNGHIDGIARFINPTTVVVPRCTEASLCRPGDGKDDRIFDDAAQAIKEAGFEVIRHPIEGVGTHEGVVYDTNYMNWIVGNGFVIAVGFDNPDTDASAKRRIESYFPGRDVHMIEMLGSWHQGGGAHCHTNDQPAFSTIRPQ